ncbi:MotE family protein [Aestuariibius sp. 2305UL40-4]|uniref:MotE family protein n=1 Tax=Aestuariibius violaceus TaxID=3234132 RepID=UPI00345E06B8
MSRRNGTLGTLALLLALSAVVRLGGDTGAAIAKGLDAPAPGEAMVCDPDGELTVILAELRAREDAVAAREAEVERRAVELQTARDEIAAELVRLEEAETSLAAMIALAEDAAQDDLTVLTSVYENMKPKDAAALFEEMAPDFSAGFLGRMRPEAAAEIMARLTPQSAYSISVIMAGRNANVPTE